MRALSLILCVASFSVAHATPAEDNKLQARAHFKQGAAFFAAGAWDEAISEYEIAYKLLPLPDILFNLGQAQRSKGNKSIALGYYRKYVEAQPDGSAADQAYSFIATLSHDLEQEKAAEAARKQQAEQARVAAEQRAAAEAQQRAAQAQADHDAQARHAAEKPLYKKWWLWTIVGGVVVAGAAVGLGVGLSSHPASFSATIPDLGPGAHMGLRF